MSSKFFPLRVKHIERTTHDSVVITLDVQPEQEADFRFRAGQHLTVRARVDGREVRRSYSLCSSPLEGEWKIAVKKVPHGLFSKFANEQLKVGDQLEVMPPAGRFFTEIDPDSKKQYVAFAGGSGITPVLSLLKTHLAAEPQCTFKLFYVNREVASIMLREEIEALKNKYLDRFEVFYFLTREERDVPLFNGRITPEKLDLIFRLLAETDEVDEYYICGPAEMIFTIRDYLSEAGISPKRIHFELFNTEGLPGKSKPRKKVVNGSALQTTIRVNEGGKSFTLQVPTASMSILDAALRKNADLPFACKGGVCCTCKARLLEGEVEMEVHYGLEQEQLDAGYILTCQAIPVSETITVDYDA